MTLNQAREIAQMCADQSGIDQAIAHDNAGQYFVFTCPREIDAILDEVIAPSYHA